MRTYNLLTTLQYTHKTDKFDNDLFEGDVIKVNRDGTDELFVIFFKSSKYSCGFVASQNFELNPYIEIWNGNFEKIGNIYLNPEIDPELAKEFVRYKEE